MCGDDLGKLCNSCDISAWFVNASLPKNDAAMIIFSSTIECLNKYFTNASTNLLSLSSPQRLSILTIFRYENESLKLCVSNILVCLSLFVYLDNWPCRKECAMLHTSYSPWWKQEPKELIVHKIKWSWIFNLEKGRVPP